MTGPDPQAQKAQLAMVKLLSTPPEPILDMLDRLEIPWRKMIVGEEDEECLVIKWRELRKGDKRAAEAGPFIRQLFEEMKKEIPGDFITQASSPAQQEAVAKFLGMGGIQ